MLAEKEPKQSVENTLTIQIGTSIISYPDRRWYRPYQDIPRVLGKKMATVRARLRNVMDSDQLFKLLQ